jgi:hypothetical protein
LNLPRRGQRISLFLALVLIIQGCSSYSLLTKDMEQIKIVRVVEHSEENKTHEISEEELIKKIYNTISGTKTITYLSPDAGIEQTSDPYYSIIIDYKDKTQDTIYSTETGKFIYRRLSGTGWTGGYNEDLLEVVKALPD